MNGREPVKNFVIETIYDKFDHRITKFRRKIFEEDLGLDPDLCEKNHNKEWWLNNTDQKKLEDAYKYSNFKWCNTIFDNIECIIEDGEVVGISGCRIYGKYLRTSMHLYLLKSVRKKYPGIKYLKGGWFERHIHYAQEKNLDGLFFTVYAYSRKLKGLIRNHTEKTISLVNKKYLKYIQDVEFVGEYDFNKVKQSFFYYKLKESFDIKNMSLKNKFLEDDIFPLGKFETLKVKPVLDGKPESYPNVSFLGNVDYKKLLEECDYHLEQIGNNYVKPRLNEISIEPEELYNTLSDVGFYKGSYQSFSLRKLGTSELEDWILPNTQKFFKDLPFKTFRQQYAIAYPGWNTKLHRDHSNFLTHGFRAMVPLSADVYMGYEDDQGNVLVYKLKRGGMYFVNISKMHRGFNESETSDRINLIMQMDTDKIIVEQGIELKPLDLKDMRELPDYSINYDVWEFGYEL